MRWPVASGVALAAGPIGCFVVWRRMAYFGATLAHAVLLGVALGFLLEIEPTLAILAICLLLAGGLALLERQCLVPLDTLLGVLAHGVFAAGLIVIAFMEKVRVDLMGYLFGDVLSVSAADLRFIFAIAAGSVAALAWQWRNLLSVTVNEDLAAVEGVPVQRVRMLLVILLAVVIATGMKIVGMLLVLALVIIPPRRRASFRRDTRADGGRRGGGRRRRGRRRPVRIAGMGRAGRTGDRDGRERDFRRRPARPHPLVVPPA